MRGAVPPLFVIAVTLGIGAYSVYDAYLAALKQNELDAAEFTRVQANLASIRNALAGVQDLSPFEIENGFWYREKDENGNVLLAYFDLYWTAQRGLTQDELVALRAHVGNSSILRGYDVREVPAAQLPSTLQFHNAVYGSAVLGTSTRDMEVSLEARSSAGLATSDDLFHLSYLAELSGDYAKRDVLNERNCDQFGARCADSTRVTLRGRVVDASGAPVQGARVGVLSRPLVEEVRTAADGTYSITTGAKEFEKLRIHAHKRNYSDGYENMIIVEGVTGERTFTIDDIRIESPVGIVTIDYTRRTVSGLGNDFRADGTVVIRTSYSEYEIPPQALVHDDGRPYSGNVVDVYLYEFRKGDPPPNLTQVDTFDEVRGYAGDLMKSFGMPYIQFFGEDGEELHVLSSRPMRLTYRIPDMDALYANTDNIYEPLTSADMELLVRSSQGRQYAIDREFLISNAMLRFPAFWVFDRKRGVWDNVGVDVLDTEGTIRTIFYTQRAGA